MRALKRDLRGGALASRVAELDDATLDLPRVRVFLVVRKPDLG
jgi:hypothetical protein